MDARIRILLKIIEEHGGSLPLSSGEIGGLLGLGEARVLRLFSLEMGKPLRRHLLEVRMSRAASLLSGSMLPIKFVANECGYSSVNNFYRDFRKVYGTSPLQMRLGVMDRELREPQLLERGLLERDLRERDSLEKKDWMRWAVAS